MTLWICCCFSIIKLCPTLCNPMGYSTPGSSVLHYLVEFAQTHLILCRPLLLSSSIFPILDTFWPGGLLFGHHNCLPFHAVHGVLLAIILEWVAISFSRAHVLSELFTVTHPSSVVLHGMGHSFIELCSPFTTTMLWSTTGSWCIGGFQFIFVNECSFLFCCSHRQRGQGLEHRLWQPDWEPHLSGLRGNFLSIYALLSGQVSRLCRPVPGAVAHGWDRDSS